jgi:hypothetical protein
MLGWLSAKRGSGTATAATVRTLGGDRRLGYSVRGGDRLYHGDRIPMRVKDLWRTYTGVQFTFDDRIATPGPAPRAPESESLQLKGLVG